MILDADPEVARLGYRDVDEFQVLQNASREFGMVVNH